MFSIISLDLDVDHLDQSILRSILGSVKWPRSQKELRSQAI